MQRTQDHHLRVLGNTRLTLRAGLQFELRSDHGRDVYVVEHPLTGKFYRLGAAEHALVRLLDGSRTLDEALAACSRQLGTRAFDDHDAAVIAQWLLGTDLATTPEAMRPGRLDERAAKARHRRRWELLNPFTVRVPLCHPDPWLDRWAPRLGGLFGRTAGCVWAVLACSAILLLARHGARWWSATEEVVRPGNWWLLGVAYVLLKLWHELCHAVVCRRYGGSVREAGVVFMFGVPLAYVDLTSVYRCASRWQRIHVALAGLYGESLLASLAAWYWLWHPAGPTGDLAHRVVLLAGVSSLVFNANPLMRFDGYYVLSDLLGVPNLHGQGQAFLRFVVRRVLWHAPAVYQPTARPVIVAVYGVLAALWRVSVSVTLVVAMASWFHGAGLILSLAAVGLWFGWPAAQATRAWYTNQGSGDRRRPRYHLAWAATLTLAVFCLLVPLPWPHTTPAQVIFDPLVAVRSASAGLVRTILVTEGQTVRAGQVLAVLENQGLVLAVEQAAAQERRCEARYRRGLLEGQTAQCQAERAQAVALAAETARQQHLVDELTVRAPCDGTVVGAQVEQLVGRYLSSGTELCAVAGGGSKQVLASLAQHDLAAYACRVGQCLMVRVPGVGRVRCRLLSVAPRAGVALSSQALSAVEGGPLAVRRVAHDRSAAGADAHQSFELEHARFEARLEVSAQNARQLATGQRAWVGLWCVERSLGRWAWQAWCRQ